MLAVIFRYTGVGVLMHTFTYKHKNKIETIKELGGGSSHLYYQHSGGRSSQTSEFEDSLVSD